MNLEIENVRLVETVYEDDPRFAELLPPAEDDLGFVQDKHGNWYVQATGEPVNFATKRDEALYKRGMQLTK